MFRFYILIILLLSPVAAKANLLISPLRVSLAERDRSAVITLINTSNKTKTYRLEWEEKKHFPNGHFGSYKESELSHAMLASTMIRFSPRQVRLKAGERQKVKLSVKRPGDLKDGDYRSNLKFTIMPEPGKELESGIKLNLLMSYSIPIFIRQGADNYKIDITSVKLAKKENKLNVNLSRNGSTTTFGGIKAYWQASGTSKRTEVAILNHVHFYPEYDKTNINLYLKDKNLTLKNGKLTVIYEGGQEFRGKEFASKVFFF